MSLILRRRVSAVSKDEACAQAATTSHMRWPALAGEGWGEGVSATGPPLEERALARAFGATSPAGRRER